jgi:hypothetical protein
MAPVLCTTPPDPKSRLPIGLPTGPAPTLHEPKCPPLHLPRRLDVLPALDPSFACRFFHHQSIAILPHHHPPAPAFPSVCAAIVYPRISPLAIAFYTIAHCIHTLATGCASFAFLTTAPSIRSCRLSGLAASSPWDIDHCPFSARQRDQCSF